MPSGQYGTGGFGLRCLLDDAVGPRPSRCDRPGDARGERASRVRAGGGGRGRRDLALDQHRSCGCGWSVSQPALGGLVGGGGVSGWVWGAI
ncbi:MAG: hypothetical protein LBO20_08380 [Bifidobacteriaceae bacterium]|nr:hypothetical protein [Bifidobacteriaceae bacterium]